MDNGDPWLSEIASRMEVSSEILAPVAQQLFADWLIGQTRYPTLSQQNQDWYRRILNAAGKVNPTREELKTWFGLPHGTAQYLAGVLYDPSCDQASDHARAISEAAIFAIRSAKGGRGTLNAEQITFWITPTQGAALGSLLAGALDAKPREPPAVTRLTGVVKVTCSKNQGLGPLCDALGDHGKAVQQAAAERAEPDVE